MLKILWYSLALAELGSASYVLSDSYTASNFFSKFTFYTDADPTNGYVTYVSESTAEAAGLIYTTSDQVYIGVDHTNVASGSGRDSVRITSDNSYNVGNLVILNLAHMPGSVCGTWPAFWMFGPDWPDNGEIDIIEGVNTNTVNAMTLHTSDGCTIGDGSFTGVLETDNCYIYAADQSSNAGCSIEDTRTTSYGDGFNSNGGGVFATQITSDYIAIWFWPAASVPSDVSNGSPSPTGWGTPVALFEGDCDISEHFSDLNIVFDITFCGDWAGAVWSSQCSSYGSSCETYVQNYPGAFAPSYWLINSLDVYEDSSDGTEQSILKSAVFANTTAHVNTSMPPLGTSVPLAVGGGSKGKQTKI